MKQQTVPEIELWYAASNGDAMAFGRLFELYFPKLFIAFFLGLKPPPFRRRLKLKNWFEK